ncbi:hypothetical protein L218DRAFT_164000 [Marasmius fiardii PR-910]|nr:hypothetical protein L218DRAFT_164000 [Marasmius fiardii PR-910]
MERELAKLLVCFFSAFTSERRGSAGFECNAFKGIGLGKVSYVAPLDNEKTQSTSSNEYQAWALAFSLRFGRLCSGTEFSRWGSWGSSALASFFQLSFPLSLEPSIAESSTEKLLHHLRSRWKRT